MSRPTDRKNPLDLTAVLRRALLPLKLPLRASLIAGVSGGADSTALACALAEVAAEQGWRVTLAHLHHGLRGREADADARFVERLARLLGCRFVLGRASVRDRARRSGLSIEMAARIARRKFLLAQARRRQAAAILLGHTRDDQAETVLLRLARGTSPGGLGAMASVDTLAGVPVVRPWLTVGRADIEHWLKARGQSWREDRSNRSQAYGRNRVRLQVLPLLETVLNPRAREALARAAAMLREDEAVLAAWADRAASRCRTVTGDWSVRAVARLPPAIRRRVVVRILEEAGYPMAALTAERLARCLTALESKTCRVEDVGAGYQLSSDGQHFRVQKERQRGPRNVRPFRVPQPVPGIARLPTALASAEFDIGYQRHRPRGAGLQPDVAWLDRVKALQKRLSWRSWRPGDRMAPLGMAGTRKLQDIFTDAHTPPERRRTCPILVCGREVVWVPGYRIARGWAAPTPDAPTVRIRLEPFAPVTTNPTPPNSRRRTPERTP